MAGRGYRQQATAASEDFWLWAGALKQQAFSNGGPRWRICSPGLNVEGLCSTASCMAYEQLVIDEKVWCI